MELSRNQRRKGGGRRGENKNSRQKKNHRIGYQKEVQIYQ
jgi:hypothetical protein